MSTSRLVPWTATPAKHVTPAAQSRVMLEAAGPHLRSCGALEEGVAGLFDCQQAAAVCIYLSR